MRIPTTALFIITLIALSSASFCQPGTQPRANSDPLKDDLKHSLTMRELRIWNDPDFRRRFAESYIAETDIEPKIAADKTKVMIELLDLISADKLDEAGTRLETEISGGTAGAVFYFTLANIRYQQDRLEEAKTNYEAAVARYRKFRRAYGNLAQIYFRLGEFDKAMPAFARVLELGGADALTYGLLGVCHGKLGNPISAESAFRMAALLDPKTVDWKVGMAESFFTQERFAEAAALFKVLLSASPDRPDLWMAQGKAYAMMKKPLLAAQNFEIVDKLGGSTVESLTNMGNIYANQEMYGPAVEAFKKALKKDPKATVDRAIRAARFLNGNGAHDETKDLISGIEVAAGAHLTEARMKSLLRLRARLAVADGDDNAEAEILKSIVRIDPLDGDALILLGQHSARNEDHEKAIFYYQRAASIEKFEADAKVRHAQLLVGQSKYKDALPLLRRAQTLKYRENIQQYLEQVEKIAARR